MNSKYLFKILAITLMGALFVLLLSSCSASEMSSPEISSPAPEMGEDGSPGISPQGDRDMAQEAGTKDQYSSVLPPGNIIGDSEVRFVILNGSMELAVNDTRETVRSVQEIVSKADGVVSSSYIYEIREGQYAADLTLRIPAARFEKIMEQLQELGKVGPINTGEADVTMQYLDLETRIENLKTQEERLREILEMANTVEDVLKVESELGRVRSEIEVMSSQFAYLQDQVSYSTINLTIREELIATQEITPAPFANLGARMTEALVRSVNFIMAAAASMLVLLTAALPLVLILAVMALFIWRLVVVVVRRKPPAA